jgi:hypothetical protein
MTIATAGAFGGVAAGLNRTPNNLCWCCAGLIAGKPAPTVISAGDPEYSSVTQKSLWERACPRWGQTRQHQCRISLSRTIVHGTPAPIPPKTAACRQSPPPPESRPDTPTDYSPAPALSPPATRSRPDSADRPRTPQSDCHHAAADALRAVTESPPAAQIALPPDH